MQSFRIAVSVFPDELARLDSLCAEAGVSRSRVVRAAVLRQPESGSHKLAAEAAKLPDGRGTNGPKAHAESFAAYKKRRGREFLAAMEARKKDNRPAENGAVVEGVAERSDGAEGIAPSG